MHRQSHPHSDHQAHLPQKFHIHIKSGGLKSEIRNLQIQPAGESAQKGAVTGLKAGSATITMTVTLSDGSKKSLQTKVTVKKPYLKVSGKQSVKKGKTLMLKVQKYGVKGTARWSVDKTKIAKINPKTGKLTAKAAGTVKVKVARGGKVCNPILYIFMFLHKSSKKDILLSKKVRFFYQVYLWAQRIWE